MDRENNLLFLGISVLILIVFTGANLVDTSLTKLLLPEEPFATMAVKYEHGFVFQGPQSKVSFPPALMGHLAVEEDRIELSTGYFAVKIPFVLTLGNIDSLRATWLLTK